MNSKKGLKLPGALFLLIGIIFVVAGVIVLKQGDSLAKRCTEETIGTVVEIISERSYSSDNQFTYTYYPVIEYQVGERTISQKSRSGQDPPKYKVGQQVEIYYNPNNVEEYIIKEDSTTKILGIGFIVIGSIAAAVGAYLLIKKVGKSDSVNDSEIYNP
ncbi:MAG: DUF3592 domain-containing protein [Clostridiales bacterium]|nr:DUF3592 domain-containing protein [Clostridiales bacterium]